MANQDTARSLHVVVVSDDPHIRDEARYGFPKDWTLTFADDAREVWPALRGDRPTVVVADMQTGNAGGYAMAFAKFRCSSFSSGRKMRGWPAPPARRRIASSLWNPANSGPQLANSPPRTDLAPASSKQSRRSEALRHLESHV